ncbi:MULTISPECIES: hypothetical protein [Bacteria]|jgi:hypothetical protein|uniref:hypothetical protein n=1 Tax=Bacteria TaxID=2 RepID=UPI000C99AC19|nr:MULTISPECIES: hypothetical protein [Bacteria]ELS5458885.1 hypothetical protein [Raoultella ornithinolytica]EME8857494.1 hypothetical protein [Klebsiella aerogenes]QLU28043.1 hypothetical protein HV192_29945 [Klebsiella oxytoca]DAM09656.1 MAG TPA: hypothetical protein [Caudoviricetes sp.]MCI7901753.1 hypothetical protein [Klebsiella pneumoniae]
MTKRARIEELYVVVSSWGNIVGCGIDAPSACRDAVERSGTHTNWKDMALSGSYGVTTASASVIYDKDRLDKDFAAWRKTAAERYNREVG